MKLNFSKMHALGNDFVVIDDRDSRLKSISRLSRKLCDRRFGIGADQLLLLCHSDKADFKMRIYNADGSEVEMCGNGIRCLGKYIWDNILRCGESIYAKKYCQSIDSLSIETMAGIMHVHNSGNNFRIDMGEPVFEAEKIPVATESLQKKLKEGRVSQYPLNVDGKNFKINCVSMGNPHSVTIVRDISKINLEQIGPVIEKHKLFPNRINVEFIQIEDDRNIKMRVWERGSGETMACGTGASASAVISALLGLTGRKVNVHLPGGRLLIHWSEKNNHVYMTGPAVNVYEGTIEI
jgi:diaminopimelate epimerase